MNSRPTPSRHITAANATSVGSPTETIHGTMWARAEPVMRSTSSDQRTTSLRSRAAKCRATAAEPLRSRLIQFGPSSAVRDHDQVLIDDANHAAARKLREGQGVLETLKPRADREDGAQAAFGIDDRTCDRDNPFVARHAMRTTGPTAWSCPATIFRK